MERFFSLLAGLLLITYISKAQEVIIQAETEKNEGVILKWNYDESVDSTVIQLASIISVDDKVWLLFDPSNAYSQASIQANLAAHGSNLSNVIFIAGTAENPWLRDYGPIAGYFTDNITENRHFTDAQYNSLSFPNADFLPVQLASEFNFNYEALPLNLDGGNILFDGIGRGYLSDRVLAQNPGLNLNQIIQLLYTKFNLNEIIILPSIPECGGGESAELSRLIKFTDPETVLVAQFPESVPFFQSIEELADTLAKTYNDVGKPFRVVRIPVAPGENGEYALTNNGEIRSYTSSILFNNKIIIPSYNSPDDAIALNIYSELFPGFQVIQVPSKVLAAQHGSLYRLAVNVPQSSLFRIRHSQFSGMQPFESEIWINTFVHTINPVDSIQLFYRVHPSDAYQVMNTYGCCGGNSGSLSGYTINDTISYYLKAYSGDRTQTLPLYAPETVFTFWFDLFTGIRSNDDAQHFIVYPNPANDFVTIKGFAAYGSETIYQLINMNGIVVADGKMPESGKIRIPDYLVNGLYLLKIISSGKTHLSRLYLQR